MKFRSAQTLVYSRAGGTLLGCNFLTKNVFECSVDVVAFLGELDDWQDLDEIAGRMPDMSTDDVRETIEQLVAASAIVEQGSDLARTEQEFQVTWTWGVPTALMHFCLQDPDHMTLAESRRCSGATRRTAGIPRSIGAMTAWPCKLFPTRARATN